MNPLRLASSDLVATPDAPARLRATPPSGRVLLALLRRISGGELLVTTPERSVLRFGSRDGGPGAALVLRDWSVARRVLTGGDVAFAEDFMEGRWDSPDLAALLSLLARHQAALEPAFHGRVWQQLLLRFKHALNANTRRQARRNILAHYDLGNDFYRLWLDPTMSYSAALFEGDATRSLAQAQEAKYRRILVELALPLGAHILEIGCGWGGFAEVAARAGYRVTGISLSDAQTAYARERLERAGLNDRVDFRILDYRDVEGRFDAVVSIEMFEAVGERWWPAYFRTVRRVLAQSGRACLQVITIAEARFERYRTQSDFIQQYIFPGGMLASPSRFVAEARAAGLDLECHHRFGSDYAETLRRWLAAFDDALPAVRAQGFDDRFVRCWRFYLAYCIAGFASDSTDVAQYTFLAR